MKSGPLVDRRSLVGAGLALAVGAVVPSAAAAKGFFARHDLPIGLQLYTLGGAMSDPQATLTRVRKIGYRTVELAGLPADPTPFRAAADAADVRIIGVHVRDQTPGGASLNLSSDAGQLAAVLHKLGATDAVLPSSPYPPIKALAGEGMRDAIARTIAAMGADYWKQLAAFLNQRGAALAKEGIRLGYHNHNSEFAPLGATTGWDILVRETDPRLVSFEADIGWVASTGIEPIGFVRKYSGRLRQMHVKDLLASTKPNFALSIDSTEVGSGAVDWKRLLPAAYAAGVRQFYVEQEPPFKIDRFEAAAKSFVYLDTQV